MVLKHIWYQIKDPIVTRSKGQTLDDTTYCVFDLETTGISFRTEKITEIGIMKVRNGEVIDSFENICKSRKTNTYESSGNNSHYR